MSNSKPSAVDHGPEDPQRLAQMQADYARGDRPVDIAARYGVSRQRVHQLFARYGTAPRRWAPRSGR